MLCRSQYPIVCTIVEFCGIILFYFSVSDIPVYTMDTSTTPGGLGYDVLPGFCGNVSLHIILFKPILIDLLGIYFCGIWIYLSKSDIG